MMIPDATFEPVERQSSLRLRFSLLALFLLMTIICVALAWLVQPRYVVATALFKVSRTQPSILASDVNNQQPQRDFEIVKKTQIALLKSYFVANAALRNPAVVALPILQSHPDPVEWLIDQLEVEFPQDGEILSISLRGTEAQATDLVALLDAVAKAYKDEVIYKERQSWLGTRDLLARSLEDLNKELARKWEEYLEIARESGQSVSPGTPAMQQVDLKRLDRIDAELMSLEMEQLKQQSGEQSKENTFLERRIALLQEQRTESEQRLTSRDVVPTELLMRKNEIERLQRISDDLSVELEILDIEAKAPNRIVQVQPAVATPAD